MFTKEQIKEIVDLKNEVSRINEAEYVRNKRKKYYILVDVETLGTGARDSAEKICYDVSWAIVDIQGNVYRTKAYVVEEIFFNTQMMMEAYYWNKYPTYLKMLELGLFKSKKFKDIIIEMNEDMRAFNVNIFTAYNSNFDTTAIEKTRKKLNVSEKINYTDVKVECVMVQAVHTIMNMTKYRKKAKEHKWFTDSGKFWKSTAEHCYRFLTDNPNFTEHHIGIFDVQIEAKILAYANRSHKKVDKTPQPHMFNYMKVKQSEMPQFYKEDGKFKDKEEILEIIETLA